MDYYGFYIGEEFEAYKYLGAHPDTDGVIFRTFAPNAVKISVIGEFNDWTETPMNKVYDGNFWECSIFGAKSGDIYINTNNGSSNLFNLKIENAVYLLSFKRNSKKRCKGN